jgi:uncharacterized hydrophobic protein (TIGR00271 family)
LLHRAGMAEDRAILKEVEEKASEELGIRRWDRSAIFRETADAATDSDLPYWIVLLISGGIATLGLALDSSAVVIGAMLIAPLLSPVVGLALALAVGDGRLALQTAAAVLASTLGVVATAALLTLALPFQELTPEISARTRPTTLDLVIAVMSGLAGVVVTAARGHRLSAAIPGVAISVALIPPLGVTGFGIGIGWNAELIRGSLLLYGANLAGIVLSGTLVFMLVGMHGPEVLEAARQWHREEQPTGLIARLDRLPWVRSLGVIRSGTARVGLVLGFVVAVAIPLRRTLQEITREVRVRSAVRTTVEDLFQLPASSGDIEQLAELIPTRSPNPAVPPPPPSPTRVPSLLASLRERLAQAAEALSLPDGMEVAGLALSINGGVRSQLRVGYLAPEPLPPAAEQILARQLARAVDDPAMAIELVHLGSQLRPGSELTATADALLRFHSLRVEVVADSAGAADADSAVARLVRQGIERGRIDARRSESGGGLLLRLRPGPAEPESPPSADSTPASGTPGAQRPPR